MLSLADLNPGTWYISVVCDCKERLILFPDLTEGKGTLAGAFTISCPACGTRASFLAEHYRYDGKDEATTFNRAS